MPSLIYLFLQWVNIDFSLDLVDFAAEFAVCLEWHVELDANGEFLPQLGMNWLHFIFRLPENLFSVKIA